MRAFGFIAVTCVALAAAAPPVVDSLRLANAAFEQGDVDAADRLYAAAEERTGDPGLVAFNRAAVHFARGEFREAELAYRRVLDDPECPAERRARAWFNRGTALLRRGGDAAVFRSAIACFDRSLAEPGADDNLKVDARHNLELAKLRWAEERRKDAAKPSQASARTPEEQEKPPPPRGGAPEPNEDKADPAAPGGANARPARATPTPAPGAVNPQPTEQQTPGAGNLEPLLDRDQPQALSEGDTREYLRRTADRLRRERQALLRALYGPDRPGVRDW